MSARWRPTQPWRLRARSARSLITRTDSSTASGRPSMCSCTKPANSPDTGSPPSIEDIGPAVCATSSGRSARRSPVAPAASRDSRSSREPGDTSSGRQDTTRLTGCGRREQQELQCRLVGPVRVLHHQHPCAQPGQHFGQGAEHLVAGRRGVTGRLRGGREVRGPFGEQRAQRTRQRTQAQPGRVSGGLAQGVHDRAEGVRGLQRRAAGQQHPAS
ncbi:MAG TPA: hypothetical protein VGH27_02355 [Streptosporangiaceae bacterium]